MEKIQSNSSKYSTIFLLCSLILNLIFIIDYYKHVGSKSSDDGLSWSRRAAIEAESVAAISCSGHGRAYLDGVAAFLDGDEKQRLPVCECNSCFSGPDCSLFLHGCLADADGYVFIFLFSIHNSFLFL